MIQSFFHYHLWIRKTRANPIKFNTREIPLYGYIKPLVSQMIIMACSYTIGVQRDTDGGLHIESLFRDGMMEGYPSQDHTCIPFGEANLSPSALIAGLAQYVHYIMNQQPRLDIGMFDPPAINIAKHLAVPRAFFEDNQNSLRVGTISEYFYRTPIDNWFLSHRGGWWKKYSKTVPGEWTLAIIG